MRPVRFPGFIGKSLQVPFNSLRVVHSVKCGEQHQCGENWHKDESEHEPCDHRVTMDPEPTA